MRLVKYLCLAVLLMGLTAGLAAGSLGKQQPQLTVWARASFVADVNNYLTGKAKEWGRKNGVDVRVSLLPAKEFTTKIYAAIQAGRAPDVVVHGWPVGEFANKGYLLPLDDVVDKLGRDDFFKVKLNEDKVGRHIYGIPSFFELYWLHTRKDILAQHGLDIPTDYTELAEVAKAVSNPAQDFYGLGFTLGRAYDAQIHFLGTLYAFGGGYLSCRGIEGLDMLKSRPTYNTLRYIKGLYNAGAIPPRGMSDIGNNNAYIQERIAMTPNPPSILYALKKNRPELAAKTLLVPLPVMMDGGEESAYVLKTTKHPDLAKDLVYYYFKDKEDYRKNFIEAGDLYGLPIFKSQAKIIGEEYENGQWQHFAVNPYKVLQESTIYLAVPTAYPINQASALADKAFYSLVWSDLVTDVTLGEKPIIQVVDKTYERLVSMAEELGYPQTCP